MLNKKPFNLPIILSILFICLLVVSFYLVKKQELSMKPGQLYFKPLNQFDAFKIPNDQQNESKIYIVNFWATWCGPCLIEIPELMNIQLEYASKGVQVIGVSVDDSESEVIPFLARRPIAYPIVMESDQIKTNFGLISAVPTTFILNSNGDIIEKLLGYQPREKITEILNQNL